jgi:hypothetical protein
MKALPESTIPEGVGNETCFLGGANLDGRSSYDMLEAEGMDHYGYFN